MGPLDSVHNWAEWWAQFGGPVSHSLIRSRPRPRFAAAMALHLTRPFLRPSLPSPPPPRPTRRSSRAHCLAPSASARGPSFRRPYTSVLVVPTGVGAAVGGFAGDALPVARALGAVADCVISHPNVSINFQ